MAPGRQDRQAAIGARGAGPPLPHPSVIARVTQDVEVLRSQVATSVSAGGGTATAFTTPGPLSTATVPETVPVVAVIVAEPFATAVTSPEASTAGTAASLVVHATAASAITRPFWSRTSTVSRAVSPRALSAADPGLTVTVVATEPEEERARRRHHHRTGPAWRFRRSPSPRS